jgi:PKD repeat protein
MFSYKRIALLLGVMALIIICLTGCLTVEVTLNQRPVAIFTASPTEGDAKLTVDFDGSQSYDLDGIIVSYDWNFGDGTVGEGKNLSHLYQDDSDLNNDGINEGYVVRLTVTDDKGAIDTCYQIIYVNNPPPVAIFSHLPQIPQIGETVIFNADSSYDPAGIIITPARIIEYYWNFGDGSTGRGKIAQHQYTSGGVYNVTLTIRDDDGAIVQTNQVIRVNFPPVANFTICLITPKGKQEFKPQGIIPEPNFRLGFDASLSKDPDGKIVRYDWTFWDGNKATGVWTEYYYPAQPGIYSVTLTATDNDGGKATIVKEFELY